MAIIHFTHTNKQPKYPLYKSWLEDNQKINSCAYCWNSTRITAIDHYVPKSYKPNLMTDPDNLLISCNDCNGLAMKGDYHPSHATRRSHRSSTFGYAIHNIRLEDISTIFQLNTSDGSLSGQPGLNQNRANWLIATFSLNHDAFKRSRLDLLEISQHLNKLELNSIDSLNTQQKQQIKILIGHFESHSVFTRGFNLSYPIAIKSRVNKK